MKKIVLLFALVLCVSMVWGQVIITQYYEGASNDKYIEITNVGSGSVDLTSYYLGRWTNTETPSGAASNFSQLSGTIAAGETQVYMNASAVNPAYAVALATGTTTATYFNGDDPVALTNGSNEWADRVDCIYSTGDWGGETSFYRNADVLTGNTGMSVLDGTGEWTEVSLSTVNGANATQSEYLGYHIYSGGGAVPPGISDIILSPALITSTDAVSVSAEVTEGDAAISYVELHWGLASGDLTNTISMSTSSKAVYTTDSDIPAQTADTTVYYEVYAEDVDTESSTSGEQSYTVASEETIYDIQYSASGDSPVVGYTILTNGIVTAIYNDDSYIVIQDGTGAWNGIWVQSSASVSLGDELYVYGEVVENYNNTEIASAEVSVVSTGNSLPIAASITTGQVNEEDYEGVLISVTDAQCISLPNSYGEWEIDDGLTKTACVVDDMGYSLSPTVGNDYDVTGPVIYSFGAAKIEPRDSDDIVEGSIFPPEITNIQISPESVTSSDAVSVSAEVTDSDGTLTNVELHWGITSGSLGNTINMSTSGKAVYTTDSDIPAQLDGTTVYYEILAVDDDTNETVSAEQSYYVSDSVGPNAGDLVISEVCGDAAQPGGDNGFVEIFNNSSNIINLSNVQVRYYNSNPGSPSYTLNLSGVINPYSYIVVTQDNTAFNTEYGFDADFYHGSFYFNGGDDGVDIYDSSSKALILDSFNDNGTGASPWTWDDNYDYERTSLSSGGNETSWIQLATTGTPGAENDNSLPVVLSEFTAVFAGNTPTIYWTTQSETNNSGWNLYRNQVEDFANAACINVELIEGAGTTSEPTNYSYSDLYPVTAGETYWYWLESVENNGTTETYGPITLDIPAGSDTPELPQLTSLKGNYPNPFNPQTTIEFTVKEGNTGTLTIYNAKGQVLQSVNVDASMQEYTWDAANYGSGVYFYKLETENYSQIKKMIMLK